MAELIRLTNWIGSNKANMGDENGEKKGINFFPMLIEVGFDISIPLVAFVLLGVWLDEQLHTGHLMLFTGIGISLLSSTMALYKAYKKIRVAEGAEEEKK